MGTTVQNACYGRGWQLSELCLVMSSHSLALVQCLFHFFDTVYEKKQMMLCSSERMELLNIVKCLLKGIHEKCTGRYEPAYIKCGRRTRGSYGREGRNLTIFLSISHPSFSVSPEYSAARIQKKEGSRRKAPALHLPCLRYGKACRRCTRPFPFLLLLPLFARWKK